MIETEILDRIKASKEMGGPLWELLIKPISEMVVYKFEQSKKSWNPIRRLQIYWFAQGLVAALDLLSRIHSMKGGSDGRAD